MENLPRTRHHDPAACLEQLRHSPPADAGKAQRVLSEMVVGLLAAPPAAAEHLRLLEAARAQIDGAQTELARHYASHPLPPDSVENGTLQRVVGLWRALARSYDRIADTALQTGELSEHRALLAQRRLHCAGKVVLEFFRAHRAVPAACWSELHRSYRTAEEQELVLIRVPDPLNVVWKAQSTVEGYAAVLLVDLANPFGRTRREFDQVCRWAQRLAPYCRIDPDADGGRARPAAYALDLAAEHGLRPRAVLPTSASIRRFETSRLAAQIRGVIGQFKQDGAPAPGDDANVPPAASMRLLLSLYRPWALGAAGRRFPRRGCHARRVDLCSDWPAIGFNVAGKRFEQPSLFSMPERHASEPPPTFGRQQGMRSSELRAGRSARPVGRNGFAAESWTIFDQSVNGFRLTQKPRRERLEHRQLVGVRPPDGERFLLGQVSWLMYRDDGVMEAGIQLLAGLPKVVPARQSALLGDRRMAYQPAFLLPGIPALKTGPSLVLAPGWYRPSGVVEVHDGGARQLRLTGLLLQGANFDQVSFEAVAAPAAQGATQENGR